jgi:hypothetical protein
VPIVLAGRNGGNLAAQVGAIIPPSFAESPESWPAERINDAPDSMGPVS